jgi:hypothetical protein
MAIAHRPETFVALRARHEAMRIAEAVIRGGGVNVEQLSCHSCGAELDWKLANEQVAIDCPSCGAVNELPCHLRYRIPPSIDEETGTLDYASIEPDRRHWWNEVVPTANAVPTPVRHAAAEPWPMWLKLFSLACLGLVLMSLALMALGTRM